MGPYMLYAYPKLPFSHLNQPIIRVVLRPGANIVLRWL